MEERRWKWKERRKEIDEKICIDTHPDPVFPE
jgi:hypothetical protein